MIWKVTEWEYNGHDDSDFYEIVWDGSECRRVCVGSTRYAGGIQGHAALPDEERPKVAVWIVEAVRKSLHESERRRLREPDGVLPGEEVRMIRAVRHKGIKYNAGTVGRVFWSGTFRTVYRNGYNKIGRETLRVGLELNSGVRIFCVLSALERVGDVDSKAIEARAMSIVETDTAHAAYTLFRTSAVSLV